MSGAGVAPRAPPVLFATHFSELSVLCDLYPGRVGLWRMSSGGEAAGLMELRTCERGIGHGDGQDELVGGVEERRFVVLQVAVVRKR